MKRNLILLLICAIIAAVYFWDKYTTEMKEEREEKEKELFSISQDEVGEITIEKEEEIFKAVKEGENWKLVQPFETGGDKSNWDNIARSYSEGKRQRVVVENAGDLEPFGLTDPSIEVTLAGIGGATASTICLGDKTPTSGKYYARIADSSDVLTVMSSMYTSVDKSLFDMRDKNILKLETDNVQRVEIAAAEIQATVEKQSPDEWILTKPVKARVDKSKITGLINKVKNSRIKQFIDENPDDLSAYGLIDPVTKLVFWSGEPGSDSGLAAQALLIGSTSVNEQWYARRESQENVFAIAPSDFTDMPKSIGELRMKKLTDISSWQVKKAKIISAGDVILEASKSGGDWFIFEDGEEKQADYTSVSDVMRGIIDLEIAEFVEGSTEEYDLGSPSLQFVLETDEETATIELAGPIMKDEKVNYYGAHTDPLEIYALQADAIEEVLDNAKQITLEEEPVMEMTPLSTEEGLDEPEQEPVPIPSGETQEATAAVQEGTPAVEPEEN